MTSTPEASVPRLRAGLSSTLRALRRSQYVRNILQMLIGTGLAQAITVAAAPVLTRLYAPAEYGLAASYAALVTVIGAVAALRYDFAVVLAKDDEDASAVIALCVHLTAATAILTLVVAAVSRFWLPLRALTPYGPLIFLLPLSVVAYAMTLIFTGWANRAREYRLLANSRIANCAVAAAGGVIGGVLTRPAPAAGLVIGSLLAHFVSALWLVMRTGTMPRFWSVTWDAMRRVASAFRQFPKFNLWMTLLDQLTYSLPVILFATFFSPAHAAYFALANSVLRLPLAIIGQAVAHVFFERAARQKDSPSQLRRLVTVNVRGLALVAVPFALVVVAFGPVLFSIVFGAGWAIAGTYARYLVLASCLGFICAPISMVPSILNQQHVHLALALLTFGARAGAIIVGIHLKSAPLAVGLYALGEGITLLVFLGWLILFLKRRESRLVASQT